MELLRYRVWGGGGVVELCSCGVVKLWSRLVVEVYRCGYVELLSC